MPTPLRKPDRSKELIGRRKSGAVSDNAVRLDNGFVRRKTVETLRELGVFVQLDEAVRNRVD